MNNNWLHRKRRGKEAFLADRIRLKSGVKNRVMAAAGLLLFSCPILQASGQGDQQVDPLKLARTQRFVIPRLNGTVEMDGLSFEPAWEGVRPFPMIMQMPNFGEAPSERTEVLMAFDDEFLYIAGRMYDTEPSKIQAPTKKRDAMIASTDWLGLILDTFNDKENAMSFFTTPSGLRFDATVFNDAKPASDRPEDMPINLSWNTFWDVAIARTTEGWFAEMRIPVSSLRFQDVEGKVVMGVIIWRWISRKNEVDIFPAVPQNWGQWSSWKASQAQEVEFHGLHSRKPLYVTPYILGGISQNYELNSTETAYDRLDDPEYEMGLDVKYGLTSNLTLDVTLNTDFAQVEADDMQVNLTRFSLFFPEKRLFFQERSSNFDFNLGGPNRLFYSRRIGIYEGKPVRIYGGARLVGRLGAWDVGMLMMQTASVEDKPSENFTVYRLRRRVFNPYSYLGGILTRRIGRDGSYNVAYGLDGIIRLFGDDYLSFHWAQTFETDAENRPLSLRPSRVSVDLERRTQRELGYSFSFSRTGVDFNPGIGFLVREDYTRLGARLLYGWVPGESSFLYTHNVFLDGSVFVSNGRNELESIEFGPGWEFTSKSGWIGRIAPKIYYESVLEAFSLSASDNDDSEPDEAVVPIGRYTFAGLTGMLVTPMGRLLSALITLDAGSFYDGWRLTLGLMPQLNLISDLELSGLVQYNHVRFPMRRQEFIAPIVQVRLLATLSTLFSAGAFIQYNGGDNTVIANVRIRYNPQEGTDFYLVYNEGLNTDRTRQMPHLPFTSDRTLAFKFSYTFTF